MKAMNGQVVAVEIAVNAWEMTMPRPVRPIMPKIPAHFPSGRLQFAESEHLQTQRIEREADRGIGRGDFLAGRPEPDSQSAAPTQSGRSLRSPAQLLGRARGEPLMAAVGEFDAEVENGGSELECGLDAIGRGQRFDELGGGPQRRVGGDEPSGVATQLGLRAGDATELLEADGEVMSGRLEECDVAQFPRSRTALPSIEDAHRRPRGLERGDEDRCDSLVVDHLLRRDATGVVEIVAALLSDAERGCPPADAFTDGEAPLSGHLRCLQSSMRTNVEVTIVLDFTRPGHVASERCDDMVDRSLHGSVTGGRRQQRREESRAVSSHLPETLPMRPCRRRR